MTLLRLIVRDFAAALAVLALVFLSLGISAPVDASAGMHVTTASADWCGDQPAGDSHHAPCHACRADPVALPPAPGVCERLAIASTAGFAPAIAATVPAPLAAFAHAPRAPPAVG